MSPRHTLLLAVSLLLTAHTLRAQESIAYTTIVKSGVFIVGSNNAPSGMYYQHPSDDTIWTHKGPRYTRGFSSWWPKPLQGDVQYVAGGNGLFKVEKDGSFRVTTDWRITEVLDVVAPASDPKTVYIATAYGVWRSNDGAESWQDAAQATGKPGYTSKLIIDHSNEQRLYSASYEGAFVSDDGARTWKRMEGLTMKGILVIRQHPKNPKILIAGTEDNGLYLSTDAGTTWKKCEAGIDHSTFYAIAFDPQQPDVIYAGGYVTGVYRSTDGGASWHRINEGLKDLNIHAIAVDPHNSRCVYAATLGDGLYRTDDGGVQWRKAGLTGAQVWDVKFFDR